MEIIFDNYFKIHGEVNMEEVKKIKNRDEISQEYKWNIEAIYNSTADWEKAFSRLKEMAPKLSTYSGKLANSTDLLEFLNLREETFRLSRKLSVYANMKMDENTGNSTYQALKDRFDTYFSELLSMDAFFIPEILSLGEDCINKSLEGTSDLRMYRFFFDKILMEKPHTLTKEKEELLAFMSDALYAPEKIYSMLSDADMKFPNIKDENGNDVELSEANYISYLNSKDRRVRKDAFDTLFGVYYKFKNTIAASLSSAMKNLVLNAKIRNYSSSLEASLKPNNIPVDVYSNLIDAINKNLKSLHRYVRIKKKLLGLYEIHMYDLYVPLIELPEENVDYNHGLKLVREGLTPLGDEYMGILNEGVANRWVDVYPNRNKRSGAYSTGNYDTMPYILLNFDNTLDDTFTLAHELGHSIHSYYSNENQPYIYSNYSLFCAEVASTTNENLLVSHLINKETDKNKKLYLINQEIENIRTTIFRQVMFAEFERMTHATLERGESLTAEDLCKMWHDLNVKYYGPDMVVDEKIDIEWARIPHFYWNFYVYQYATGYAAAYSFANKILNKEENAVELYKGFLKSGDSNYPIEALKNAGVDMTTSKPIEDTIRRFEELMDMLEEK
jgi:oligoendopeptidase F